MAACLHGEGQVREPTPPPQVWTEPRPNSELVDVGPEKPSQVTFVPPVGTVGASGRVQPARLDTPVRRAVAGSSLGPTRNGRSRSAPLNDCAVTSRAARGAARYHRARGFANLVKARAVAAIARARRRCERIKQEAIALHLTMFCPFGPRGAWICCCGEYGVGEDTACRTLCRT